MSRRATKQSRGARFGLAAVLAVLAGAVAFGLGCGRAGSDAWVVEIDGGGVRLADLQAALEERLEQEGPERRDDILNEELERLVEQQIALRRAEQLGIEISDEEVAAWVETLHGGDFETSGDYAEAVRRELAGERAAITDLAPQLHVGEDQVLGYFEEHRDEYQQPARVQIRQIVVDTEGKALQLRSELRQGTDFAAMAEAHSLAPEAAEGGSLPPYAQGELPDVFDRAFELELDEISPVLHSPYGYHIFLLVARFPPQVPELADVREKIVAELETEQLTRLKRDWLRDLRRETEIKVNERVLEQLQ